MWNLVSKYLTYGLGKRIGWALVRWGIKRSENKVDDSLLDIRDKIVSGDLDGIEKDVERLADEVAKLVKASKEK